MTCLIKSQHREELNKLTQALGSEEAAYYILACNNGHPIDHDPSGLPSKLYELLLESFKTSDGKFDGKAIILAKALCYLPEFAAQHGAWVDQFDEDGNPFPEPSIDKVLPSGANLFKHEDVQSLFSNPDLRLRFKDEISNANLFSLLEVDECLRSFFEEDRSAYIDDALALYQRQHTSATKEELLAERNRARIEYNRSKLEFILNDIKTKLAQAWGMQLDLNGNIDANLYTDQIEVFRARFIQTLAMRAKDPQYASAIINVIKQSIGSFDVFSSIHSIVNQYIDIYHDSAPVKDILKHLGYNVKDPVDYQKGLVALKKLLCDRSKIYAKDQKHKAISKLISIFWKGLSEVVHAVWHMTKYPFKKIFGKPTSYVPLYAQNNILLQLEDDVLTFVSLNEDLTNTNVHSNSVFSWVSKEVKDTASALRLIKEGLISKRKSLTSVANKANLKSISHELVIINQLISSINEIQTAMLELKDTKEALFFDAFLSAAISEVKEAGDYLDECSITESNIDILKLMTIKTNVVGFYSNVFQNCIKPIQEFTANPLFKKNGLFLPIIDQLEDTINALRNKFDTILSTYLEHYLREFIDVHMSFMPQELRSVAKTNTIGWLKNMISDGELPPFEFMITPARASKSLVVRVVDQLLRETEYSVEAEARSIANELEYVRTQNRGFGDRLSLLNSLRRYAEVDADGNYTGNFITDLNRGEFDRLYNEYCALLCERYNGVKNEDTGEVEFIDDFDDSRWKGYHDDLDKWLGGYDEKTKTFGPVRAHRRYVWSYYVARREYLSKQALEQESILSKQIADLYRLCLRDVTYTVNGKTITEKVPVTADLSTDNLNKLNQLLEYKTELANPYIVIRDAKKNVISIREKPKDLLKIAKEFIAWNNYKKLITSKMESKPNTAKFNAVLSMLQDEVQLMENKLATLTVGTDEYNKLLSKIKTRKQAVDLFIYDNTARRINPELYKNLKESSRRHVFDENLLLLFAKRNQIISLAKVSKGHSLLDLSRFNDDVFAELKSIDTDIAEYLSKLKGFHIEELDTNGQFLYGQLFGKEDVKYIDPTTGLPTDETYFTHLLRTNRMLGSNIEKYFYQTPSGKRKPLTIFLQTKPISNASQLVFGTASTDILIPSLPSGAIYTTFEGDDPFNDPEFDESSDEFMLINKVTYRNKKFFDDNIEKDEFYKKMLEVMELAWKNYEGVNRGYKYKLPQREADPSVTWSRWNWWNPYKAMKNQLLYKYHMLTDLTTVDTDINENYIKSADGTIVESIPIRYVGKLKNPVVIDTDLVSSIADFYKHSLEYRERRRIAPLLEAIKFQVAGSYSSAGSSSQAGRIEHELSRRLYGRTTTGFGKGGRMTKNDIKYAKLSKALRSATHRKLMAHNFRSVFKNGWDSLCNIFTQAFVGKYFKGVNLLKAVGKLGKNIFGLIMSIGRSRSMSDTDALMLLNGIGVDFHELYSDLNKWWIRRMYNKTSSLEFEVIDYTYKALITESIYDTYRLLYNPMTMKYVFVNEPLAELMFLGNGSTRESGRVAWNKAEYTLRQMYKRNANGTMELRTDSVKLKNGKIINIQEAVRPRGSKAFEATIASTILQISGTVNGILNDQDKNKLAANYVGAVAVAFRGWMIAQGTEFYKSGTDFYEYKGQNNDIEDARLLIDAILKDADFDGQFNFATGTVDKGLHQGLFKTLVKQIKFMPTLMLLSKNYYKKHGMTESQYHQLRNFNAALFFFMLTIASTLAIYNLWYMDDDDDWKASLAYSSSIASISERASQLGIVGFAASGSDITKSITVSTSYWEDLKYLYMLTDDLCTLTLAQMNDTYITDKMPDTETVATGTFLKKSILLRDITKALSLLNVNDLPIELSLDLANTMGCLPTEFENVTFREYNLNYMKSTTVVSNEQSVRFYSNIWPTPIVKNMLETMGLPTIYGQLKTGRKKDEKPYVLY